MSAQLMTKSRESKKAGNGLPETAAHLSSSDRPAAPRASISDPRKELTNGDPPKLMLWGCED